MADWFWSRGGMLLAGAGIPAMAAMSGSLGREIGAPGAALTLFAGALCCACAAVVLTGGFPLAALGAAPRHLWFGGAILAGYVLAVTIIGPRIGLGNAILLVLFGQMLSAALIDHFGWLSSSAIPLTRTRLAGLLLSGAGIVLAQRPPVE